ncbi:putative beta-lactamase-type transpeptidase fold domain-containing protein [Rosellinia necatrix]|uniref:Putative beta-lactamase-type transpeptidase fold domain-containing protein n=1 Tax=Rosellinia necatrix TaxID=77044 RepID=A0A1W2TJ97_ROSNE|nr:putative beta-lactamase-type transpeptidase fold domain-containing protein [Rosellinia necatrix]
MPCFKGIAVSIHANLAPIAEYGMQKQSRLSRISTYIPVPQPQLNPDTSKHEPAKFAISITLLTPGHPIPYTTPKPTLECPNPKPLYAGPLPSTSSDPSLLANTVTPYIPMTHSENETIAAYIYFDGRGKEEVATLLRPGEETWVNSRWVQVPESEGGGLAEREFLFREVGLERWLNGLDLKGHDAAEKVEKRRQKFERRRRRQKSSQTGDEPDQDKTRRRRDTLTYRSDDQAPLANSDDDDDSSLSDDDEPPEATGQIKVAMFRVIASGEIKKGEYSPQFDAHDDDDDSDGGNKDGSNGAIDADVEHTTSFAKPKTLDPKTISTQTVTGIDGPDKPYAVFTFFYRGQRQLQKMGIVPGPKESQKTPTGKRRSTLDFSGLGPLKATGTVGFSAFRDQETEAAKRRKARRKSNGNVGGVGMDEDSDDDDDDENPLANPLAGMEDVDDKIVKSHLGPEDAQVTGELQAGIDRIRLKRQHSAEPDSADGSTRKSPSAGPYAGDSTPPRLSQPARPAPDAAPSLLSQAFTAESTIGSPMKKHRANADDATEDRSANFPSALGDVLGRATADQHRQAPPTVQITEDDEL